MARLEDVLPAYREGKAITRSGHKLFRSTDKESWKMMPEFLLAEDWLVIEDPITITREQFERAWIDAFKGKSRFPTVKEVWEELQK